MNFLIEIVYLIVTVFFAKNDTFVWLMKKINECSFVIFSCSFIFIITLHFFRLFCENVENLNIMSGYLIQSIGFFIIPFIIFAFITIHTIFGLLLIRFFRSGSINFVKDNEIF